MQLKAKLISKLPVQTGEGKNGQWKKQTIIVETFDAYPKKICITIWGDKVQESVLTVGSALLIDFDLESREYNDKWYTDVKAWKIESANDAQMAASAKPSTPPFDDFPPHQSEINEDLPF